MGWVKTSGAFRAQASLEYLLAFAMALGIMVVAAYVILGLGSSVGNIQGGSCSFDLGISCTDVLVASNSTSTVFALLGSNSREYPVNGLRLSVALNGVSTQALCPFGKILPGQTFVCYATLGTFNRPASSASGNITASVGYCGFNGGDCGSAVHESYAGRYNAPTGTFTKPQIGLVLYAPNIRSNGPYTINATFDIFGVSLYLGTLTLTPQPGSQPKITYSGPDASVLGVSVGTLANGCAAVVNVTYTNKTATGVYALNASDYNSSKYTLSGNTNGGCMALASSTKTVSVSGKNNTAGLFTLSNVFINVSSTGSQNNLAVFNSTATLKIAGNYNNVTMFNSNAVLTITGTYNMVRFVNSRISNFTASGNNNLIVLDNTTVAKESITGVNDIVQGS